MSFQDIKGQDKTIEFLKDYIRQSRLGGGYLFTGPKDIGKKLVAKTLAKAVNCEEKGLDSCDRCNSCLRIDKNEHPDFHLIDINEISDAIKIEYIRQLQKEINLKPYEARYKVFIINHAENLTAEAQNAVLKTLEEPPQHSLIILIASNPKFLFKTIISRCQIFKFNSLPRLRLEQILKENYQLDNNLAHFLAYFSEGRIGEAIILKDTDILREKNRIIDQFVFPNTTIKKGFASGSRSYTEATATFGTLKKSGLGNLALQNRQELRGCLNILSGWFRDLYLIKIGMPYSELINIDRKNELLSFMQRYSFSDLDEIINSISDSLLYLEQNVNIKLLLSKLQVSLWKS